MSQQFAAERLVQAGFAVERVEVTEGAVELFAHARSSAAQCPDCNTVSRRVHSRYSRASSDLPAADHRIELHIRVRRFR